jgi:YidC/Oxa1 family membrane protein insertase
MEKRILIAFVLSFGVLFAFQFLYPPPPTVPKPAPPAAAVDTPSPAAAAVVPAEPSAAGAEDIREESSREQSVKTDSYTAVVSNTGGVVKSFKLTRYSDAEGKPLELINGSTAGKVGWPLAIVSGNAEIDKAVADARFRMRLEGEHTVSLEYAAQGVHAAKRMEFDPGKYLVRVSTSLRKDGMPVVHQLVLQGGFGDQSIQPPDPAKQQAIYGGADGFTRAALSGIKEPQEVTGALAGIEDRYFLAMFLAPQDRPARLGKSEFSLPDGTTASSLFVAVPSTQPMDVYIGPKQDDSLSKADVRLAGVPDYGFFGIITKPLIIALRGIHHYIGNYGWAIVILTVIINIVMFPLRVKQQVSMQKMQKLAPHMKSLQEKYKKLKAGDPKRAEVEAELTKMTGQQMSGCLPSLLQMPLLFAFWSMLSVSIELRQAPWILWLKDLSQHDPYYVIPIMMGASMFISQKMMPTSMDPAQAKMMMIMPLVFLGFFLWAQSGVALYWLTSNVVGIAQTWFIKKYWSEDEPGKAVARQRKAQGE